MVRERIDLEFNILGGRQLKELEESVAGLAARTRDIRFANNALLKQAVKENKALTQQQAKDLKLDRLAAEYLGLEKQRTAAILATDKKIYAEKVKQLRIQEKIDKSKQRELDKAARIAKLARDQAKASRQRGQQGGLIGAGFPLLFGGGAGSVIGGGVGGLAGEKFLGKGGGFAGSIALSAIGAQIDQLVTDSNELATATGSLQGAYEYLGEKSLWLSEETKLQADAYIKAGDAAGLQKIANQQLALVQGVDGVDAAKKLYGANQELDLAMAVLKQSFLNFATFLLNKIVPIINAIAGTAASNVVLGNAREMAKDDPALLKKINQIAEDNTTKTPMLEGALKSAFINILAGPLAPAANEILNPKGVKNLTEISKALSKLDLNAPDTIQATLADRAWLDRSGKGSKGGGDTSNRDAENLLRAQQIFAIEQKRLTLMQTMEPMIGRAAAARDRAYAIAKAQFDTDVAKSKITAQDIPDLEKKIKLDTEDLKLQQKLTVLKRKNTERLMQEEKTLKEIIQYSQLDYEIATATTREQEKQLKLKKQLLRIENSGATDPQKDAQADAAKKMAGISDLDKYVAQLNKELTDTDAMIIQLSGTIINEFSGAMSSAITGLITGTKTAQEAFSEMFANIGKAFIDMATQMIAKALVMKALGILTGGMGGSGGGSSPFAGVAGGAGGVGFAGGGAAVPFAEGGYVTGPTNAMVGEAGQPEYVIPSSKMSGAMDRWNAGARGDDVIPESGSPGGKSGGSSSVDVSYSVTQINGMNFVTEDQFQQGLAQAAKEGGMQGESRTLRRLQTSPATRRRVGV